MAMLIWYQRATGAPPHSVAFRIRLNEILKSLDWKSWSSSMAAKITRFDAPRLLFMGSQ